MEVKGKEGRMERKEKVRQQEKNQFCPVAKNRIIREEKDRWTRPEAGENFPKPGTPGFKDGSKKNIEVRPVT
jgi:hypothetical protein